MYDIEQKLLQECINAGLGKMTQEKLLLCKSGEQSLIPAALVKVGREPAAQSCPPTPTHTQIYIAHTVGIDVQFNGQHDVGFLLLQYKSRQLALKQCVPYICFEASVLVNRLSHFYCLFLSVLLESLAAI